MDASEIDHPNPEEIAEQADDLVHIHCNRCGKDVITTNEFVEIGPHQDETNACDDCFIEFVRNFLDERRDRNHE